MRFNIGKRFGRLAPHERRIVERLKKGEITGEEAERLLGGHVAERRTAAELDAEDPSAWARPAAQAEPSEPPMETSEEEKARLLVERIAAEIDAERDR
jgi:hypothetical protein